jgi:UDP-N-acetyl-D-glucosamine/UDP-N-acetyl-D-galactosamine dehydrogenase
MTRSERRISVVGLGYVGLPVAVAFGRSGASVVGFDIDDNRITELSSGHDGTREVPPSDLVDTQIRFTSDPDVLREQNFHIITVPTPIDATRRPDLSAIISASEIVGRALSPGAIVVYESTLYPGATEEVCVPILERASGLACGRDFNVGYSPERINPGDPAHRFESICKVVAAKDPRTLDVITTVYDSVVSAPLHRAPSIKVAEMAKVIENSQRDLNIAFMNELSAICRQLGVDTHDVLAAASTKWNFLTFVPGLVGGHCIGVDPYYLTYRAEQAGHHPEIILAGRRINDSFPNMVAHECIRMLVQAKSNRRRVGILGLSFKENVPDVRNSKVVDIVRTLHSFDIDVAVCDPVADRAMSNREHGIELVDLVALAPCGAVIYAVPHASFLRGGWETITCALGGEHGIVLDVKARLNRETRPHNITLWRP